MYRWLSSTTVLEDKSPSLSHKLFLSTFDLLDISLVADRLGRPKTAHLCAALVSLPHPDPPSSCIVIDFRSTLFVAINLPYLPSHTSPFLSPRLYSRKHNLFLRLSPLYYLDLGSLTNSLTFLACFCFRIVGLVSLRYSVQHTLHSKA